MEGVVIGPELDQGSSVNYAIGTLNTGLNADNAARFLAYLATSGAQGIHAKYGFVTATAVELTLKPIPE